MINGIVRVATTTLIADVINFNADTLSIQFRAVEDVGLGYPPETTGSQPIPYANKPTMLRRTWVP